MSFIGTKDYNLEVLKGNVPGSAVVIIIGHDDANPTTRTTYSPGLGAATGDINQSTIHVTPAVVSMASTNANDTSAGTGLRTVLLSGLDSNGNAQTETISLNGTTAVASVNTY